MKNKNELYAGIIWILSGLALTAYAFLVLKDANVPGVESIIYYLLTIDTKYIYVGAVISVFIEGLYFIGSFFPGASIVILLAILSQTGGIGTLLLTLLLIFSGWCVSGAINIYLAKIYRTKILKMTHDETYQVKDHTLTTWFPAFRASHEVAQIAEGGKPMKVFLSSMRVRFWATVLVGVFALILPLFFDVTQTTNEEGLVSIIVVVIISFWVGVVKIRKYYAN